MATLISIVIPIYNSAKYLDECLASILRQTYKDFECILVDDGSRDNSLEICQRYASEDNRLKCISQANAGASAARNTGMKAASGEYICFIDSDDYINEHYLQDLVSDLHGDTDLVIHGMMRMGKESVIDRGMHVDGEYDLSKGKDFFDAVNIERYGGPYCKLFSRSITEKNKLQFNTKIKLAEDLDFLLRYMVCCKKVVVSSHNNYFYREVDGSASAKIYSYDTENNGLHALDASWSAICDRFNSASLSLIYQKSLSYYVSRLIPSIYKDNADRKTRIERFQNIPQRACEAYRVYYHAETKFLVLVKFLFTHRSFFLLDLVLNFRMK